MQISVTTDVTNIIAEHNLLGTGESNNAASVTVTSILAAYPDLIPSVPVATPGGSYTPGQPVTVTWTTSNAGNASTGANGWTEQLIVTDLSTGHQIELASVVQPDNAALAAGGSVARSVTFAWPTGTDATGNYSFVVSVDTTNRVLEANPAGTGESNNRSELDVLSAPDLTVTGLQAAPGSVPQAGGQLTLQWVDSNIGTAATPGPWSDRVTIYNADTGVTIVDAAVPANPGPAALLAGATLARSVTVSLPTGVNGAGTLQVTVTTNRDINNQSQITEASANGSAPYNNSQQISLVSAQLPHADLVATGLAVPATGQGGSTINVGWTVTNAGTVPTNAASWTDQVVFSTDAIIGNADDVVIGSFVHAGALAPGASYTQLQPVTLPSRFDGTGYIAVLTDPAGAVTEPNRGTEYITKPAPIAVTSLYSDLATEAVSVPATANDGDRISVSWRVRNLGDAATAAGGGWNDSVYLSQTDSVTPGSILLGVLPHGAGLAAGGAYTATASFALPGGVTGAYHVLVVTNANNADYEGGRTANNTGEALNPLLIGAQPAADLAVTAVGIPATTVPGVPATITFTVQNKGEAIARGPWTDQLVLLYGANFANSASLVTVQRAFDLAVGASYTVTATVTLPALPDGPVEIAAQTDIGAAVNEEGRTANNTLDSTPFATTHPDLVPVQVAAPTALVSGQTLTVTYTTVNNGTGPALPGWTETVTLVQAGVQTIIGAFTQTATLAAGGSIARRVDYTLPVSFQGAYQVLVSVDAGNTVAETPSGEANNTVANPLAITLAPYADLAVSNVTAPAITIADPATVTIGWTVNNIGTGAGITSNWTDEIVASPDNVPGNADDVVLASYLHTGGLALGASYTNSQIITLPPGFNGRYHLFVRTNTDGSVFENGSTANDAAQSATPFDVVPYAYADDIVTAVVPGAASSGQNVQLTWTVANQGIGTTDVSEWVDNVYLSATPDGANRQLLGTFDHLGYLAVGGSYTRSASVLLPNGITGTYYFSVVTAGSSTPNFNAAQPGAAASGAGAPYEFIYTANDTGVSAATTVTLTPAPDLVVSTVSVPATAPEGSAISVTWTVSNQGGGPANGAWTDNLVLHQVGDPNPGTVIGSYTHMGPLIAGQSYTRTEQITLPLHVSGGYQLIVVTDANNSVYEGPTGSAAEGNNQTASATPVLVSVLPRPDLVVSSVTAPATVNAGASASVSFVVTNVGAVSTGSAQWTDNVYLSLDGNASDGTLIGSLPNGSALNPQQQYSTDAGAFVVPIRYSGTVYLIVQADANNGVDEYPFTNGTTVTPFYVNPAPLADLVVSNVTAPALTFPGQQATVHYTVTNQGAGPTNLGNYAEQIWLTTDKQRPNPGKGDVLLTEIQYTGGVLVKGQGYDRTVTVTLPNGLVSGTYYLTAWVDPYGTLLQTEIATNINSDDPNEIQNDNYKAGNATTGGTQIIGVPPAAPAALPDVAVSITADPIGAATQNFTFSWTVTNKGPGAAVETDTNPFYDTVYLSDKPTLETPGASVWTLGVYDRLQDLAAGQSYTNTQTVLLNPAARGLYVIVQTTLGTDLNANNNEAQTTTSVTGSLPNLQVSKVTAASSADSGEATTISYTVVNAGTAAIWQGTQYWEDDIYLSRDATFIASRATELGSVQHANTGLAAGASYTESFTGTLPQGIGGQFYIYVFINQDPEPNRSIDQQKAFPTLLPTSGDNAGYAAFFSTHAYEDPAGNMGQTALPVVYKEADLVVSDFQVPATMAAGSTVQVTFTVTNAGNRATRQSAWTDKVFLSLDASLDNSDDLLTALQPDGSYVSAEYDRKGVLAAGASYTATVTLTLPFEISGAFFLLADTDSGFGASGFSPSSISPRLQGIGGSAAGAVSEFQGEGNNVTARPVTVTAYNAPDLVVSTVAAPLHVTLGGAFSVTYTVTDQGGDTPTLQSDWNDLVYLSVDPNLDLQADRYIGSYRHTGGLASGGSYSNTLTFNVPSGLPGNSYYVFVVTDPAVTNSTGEVFEKNETNNATASTVPMIIDTPPPTDLQVDSITAPGNAMAGDPIHISWVDSDHSTVPVSGTWTDSVYLSTDGVWSIDDKLLGRVSYSGTLNQGDTAQLSLDATLPGVAPGDYRIIVRTNIYNTVYEGVFAANNTTASATAVSVAVPTLTIGSPLTTNLMAGQQRLYQVVVPEGQTLRLTLTADNNQSVNSLFIKYGAAPTAANYDATYSGPLSASLTALIPSTKPGTYYVLVQGYSGPAAGSGITLLAEELPLVITGVATDVGGDGKYVTTTITGAQFSAAATVKLVRPGIAEYTPVSDAVNNSTSITAVFDLTNAPHGEYDIEVTNPDGSQAIIPYRFLVAQTVEPDVTVGIGGSRTILAGDSETYSIALDNLGNLDAPYTFFQAGVPNLGDNQYVYGLPYLTFSSNIQGAPLGVASSANANVPYSSLNSTVDTNGFYTSSGFLFNESAGGADGVSITVQTYPGLQALHDRAFASFRALAATFAPNLDGLLAKGAAGLSAWFDAFKQQVSGGDPQTLGILNQIDFVGMYNQNQAVPSDDVIPFIPFRFSVFAAATTMTRDEFVTYMTNQALQLRTDIINSVGTANAAPASLLALVADPTRFVNLELSALQTAGILLPQDGLAPISQQQDIQSLLSVLASGILYGPSGTAIRSTGNLLNFFDTLRTLYGNNASLTAPLAGEDPRMSDAYVGDVPIPALPTFSQYDQHLSTPTTFEAFNIYVPWVPFEDRGAGLPADFQINGPSPAGADPFASLDFSNYFSSPGAAATTASLTGPQTYDTAGFLPADTALPYTVNFNNAPAASTYVNQVTIVTQLDPSLDPYTFQLGDIKIGGITIHIPAGQSTFTTDIDFSATRGFILRVSAGIDLSQNPASAKWIIQAIDPLTGEPLTDPSARGLLMPNDAAGRAARGM